MEKIKSYGELFDNGEAIEVVRAENHPSGLKLLHWHGSVVQIAEKVERQGRIYELEEDLNFVRAVRLPTGVHSYGPPASLIANLAEAFTKFSALSDAWSRLVAFTIVRNWLFDCGSFAPRLTLVGPPSREADQLLRLLGAFCRHPLMLTGVSPSTFWSLPFQFGLTLVLRRPHLTRQLRRALDAATSRGHFVWLKGQLLEPFAPVVVHTDKPLGESAALTGIEVPVWPSCKGVPILDTETEEKLAAEYQNQLLGFRLENFASVRKRIFDPAEFGSPIREVARSLGSCFPNDSDLQREVVVLLRDADAHAALQRATDEQSLLLECLLFRCHEFQEGGDGGVHAGKLANDMLVLSKGRGDPIERSARAVGDLLRALGFHTQGLDRNGRGILFNGQIAARVHELAASFKVPAIRTSTPRCATCKALQESLGLQSDTQQVACAKST